jgi:small subunit ribosomal protein S8
MMHEVVKVLRSEGYIRGFSLNSKQITVYLKYLNNRSTSNNMLLISKPSRRIFYTYNDILKKASSRGALILSTSKGVLSSTDALGFRVGGEVLFFIN